MFSFVDHTSELEIRLEASTREGVFAEAVAALHDVLTENEGTGSAASVSRSVCASAADDPTLLAAWLDELVFLAETEGFVAERAETVEVSGSGVRGQVSGRLGSPPHLVKGVTYNHLELHVNAAGWVGRVVLDV